MLYNLMQHLTDYYILYLLLICRIFLKYGTGNVMNNNLTCAQNDHKLGVKSRSIVGEQVGISSAQVSRYVRLTELIPELLDFVDKKRIQFTVAVDISYIDKEIQKWIYEYIKENGTIKPKQIAKLREECESGVMTQPKLISIFNESQTGNAMAGKLTISEKKLREYFPSNYGSDDMKNVLFQLLEKWKNGEVQ